VLYDQYFIDDLKTRADLVRIIEPYAPLKKKGANWMACCPFHQEKTPSFSVNPGKGFYKCFGCGKAGTAFNFLMEMEGLSFPEAVRRVAEIAGVPLPEPVDDERYRESKKKREAEKAISEKVIELNRLAMAFWQKNLQSGKAEAKAARKYLEDRGISQETVEKFKIGYATESWDELLGQLTASGADDALLAQSGLVSQNEEKTRMFDRFRGRIIFPVLDASGNPVAFGARILGKGEPKYLNSPETPAYIKGDHLYGLFQTKEEIRRLKFAILVEGYLDLISLHQNGVTNCVASLGTAFTEHQARLLGRFARKVVVNYDGDKAGVKAARRAIETLLAEDFEIKVLVLPNGQDPDDFIRQNGYPAYKDQHKSNATTYLQFVLDTAMQDRSLSAPKQKAEAIEEVLPVLSSIKNGIQRRESFDQAMSFLRVDDAALRRELWNSVKGTASAQAGSVTRQVARSARAKMTVAEQRLLELLFHDGELREIILQQLEETDFESLATASIFRALIELGEGFSNESVMTLVSGDEIAEDTVPLLMMGEAGRDGDEAIDEVLHEAENCLLTLRSLAISRRIIDVNQELMLAEQRKDADEIGRLVSTQIELARIKRELETRTAAG
jgi:DNA primase